MSNIFIATPTYDGRVHTQYAMSCVEAIIALKNADHVVYFVPNLSSTLLVLGRNTLIQAFMSTDSTHLMFIDHDVGFDGTAINRLLEDDKDFVAGIYPSRKAHTFIYNPIYNEDGSFISDKDKPHLIKACMVPSGFMLIKRAVIQRMLDHYAYLSYKPKHGGGGDTGVLLFNTDVIDGEFWSEDYVFCKRATDIGIDIWIEPSINFNHAGVIGGLELLPEVQAHMYTINSTIDN